MELDVDNLRRDSLDFAESEAKSAVLVESVADMIAYLRSLHCGCGEIVFPAQHEQRRHQGILYCRMRLACAALHETPIVFRVAALQIPVE